MHNHLWNVTEDPSRRSLDRHILHPLAVSAPDSKRYYRSAEFQQALADDLLHRSNGSSNNLARSPTDASISAESIIRINIGGDDNNNKKNSSSSSSNAGESLRPTVLIPPPLESTTTTTTPTTTTTSTTTAPRSPTITVHDTDGPLVLLQTAATTLTKSVSRASRKLGHVRGVSATLGDFAKVCRENWATVEECAPLYREGKERRGGKGKMGGEEEGEGEEKKKGEDKEKGEEKGEDKEKEKVKGVETGDEKKKEDGG